MAGLIAMNSKAIWAIGLGLAGAVGAGTFVKTQSGQPLAVALVEKIRGAQGADNSSKIKLLDSTSSKKVEGTVESAEKNSKSVLKPTEKQVEKQAEKQPKKLTEKSAEKTAEKVSNKKIDSSTKASEGSVESKADAAKITVQKNADLKTTATDNKPIKAKPIEKLAALDNSNSKIKRVAPVISNEEKSTSAQNSEPKIKNGAPSIDLLRVAPDGYVVMAGRASPNEKVLAYNGNELVGETKSNATGDYVFVFDYPLTIGEHELIVTAGKDDANMVSSKTSGVVIFPQDKSNMIVLLSKPGEASKIMQMPSSRFGPKTANLKNKNQTESNVDNKVAKEEKLPIAVNAVDVEEKRYYLAGEATPKSTVNVYIDNEFKGKAITGEEGAFLYYGRESISVGKHAIRVDMLGTDNETVTARAEVVLDHQTQASRALALAAKKSAEVKAQADRVSKNVKVKQTAKNSEPLANASISSGSTGKKIADIPNAPSEEVPVKKKLASKVAAAPAKTQDEVAKIVETPKVAKTIDGKKVIKSGSSVIIRRGDSLWHVSRRKFGEGRKYTVIYTANRDQIKNPHRIYPGQVLKIPEEVKTSQ